MFIELFGLELTFIQFILLITAIIFCPSITAFILIKKHILRGKVRLVKTGKGELNKLKEELDKYEGYLAKLEKEYEAGTISDKVYERLKKEYQLKIKELKEKQEG